MQISERYFRELEKAKKSTTPTGNLFSTIGPYIAAVFILFSIYLSFTGGGPALAIYHTSTYTLILGITGILMMVFGRLLNNSHRLLEVSYVQAKYIEFFGHELDQYIEPNEEQTNP